MKKEKQSQVSSINNGKGEREQVSIVTNGGGEIESGKWCRNSGTGEKEPYNRGKGG